MAEMYFGGAELRAGQSASLRRHRLDVPVHAERHVEGGLRHDRVRQADDAADRRRRGARRHRGQRHAAIVVAHTTDNNLMKFRFAHAGVKMQAAEEDFEAAGRKFRAGAFIVAGPIARRSSRRSCRWACRHGRSQRANGEGARPRRATHRLRARLAADAGRGVGARRAGHLRRSLHVLQRHHAARRQPPREVRRDHLPARRRHGAGTDQRHPAGRQHAVALPQDRRHAATSARSTRPTTSAAAWAWKG